jgi:hypothetical protein
MNSDRALHIAVYPPVFGDNIQFLSLIEPTPRAAASRAWQRRAELPVFFHNHLSINQLAGRGGCRVPRARDRYRCGGDTQGSGLLSLDWRLQRETTT